MIKVNRLVEIMSLPFRGEVMVCRYFMETRVLCEDKSGCNHWFEIEEVRFIDDQASDMIICNGGSEEPKNIKCIGFGG